MKLDFSADNIFWHFPRQLLNSPTFPGFTNKITLRKPAQSVQPFQHNHLAMDKHRLGH